MSTFYHYPQQSSLKTDQILFHKVACAWHSFATTQDFGRSNHGKVLWVQGLTTEAFPFPNPSLTVCIFLDGSSSCALLDGRHKGSAFMKLTCGAKAPTNCKYWHLIWSTKQVHSSINNSRTSQSSSKPPLSEHEKLESVQNLRTINEWHVREDVASRPLRRVCKLFHKAQPCARTKTMW